MGLRARFLYARSVAADIAEDVCTSEAIFCHSYTEHHDATAWTAGGHLFAHLEGKYWWADLGGGYLRAAFEGVEDARKDAVHLFEAVAAVGLRVPLGRHVALKVGGEVGTEFLVFSWRAQLTAGIEAHF